MAEKAEILVQNVDPVEPIENITNGDVNQAEPDTNIISEREKELLDMVFTLESEKQSLMDEFKTKVSQFRQELEETKIENEKLKKKNIQLEQNLKQAVTSGVETPKSKKDLDEVLVKAKTLLFEKTKICKQQEQHIEMLKNQTESIKEVLAVTKEMLNLKSTEIEHLQGRFESMEARIKAEKDKCTIVEKKLGISQSVYENLRKEYDFQTNLFKELKQTYEQKIGVLNRTIDKLKEP